MLSNKDLKKKKIKSERNKLINNSKKTVIKNLIKKINLNIFNKNIEESIKIFIKFQSFIDCQFRKKLIHKNKASRYKSKIMKKINNINK